ncbi:MAG: OmpA family protein [Cryomorphaceae bacterium]|nr:OmpA family protein [Cryomorphaceae bacterium]
MQRIKLRIVCSAICLLFGGFHVLAQPELGECDREIVEVSQNQFNRAQKAWADKNQNELKRNLELALRSDKDNPHALYYFGEYQARSGNTKMAEALWVHLLDICPDYKGEVIFKLGIIMLENGQTQKALDYLERYTRHPEREKRLLTEANKILEEVKVKARLEANPLDFNPIPLKHICTEDDEYLAIISPDGTLCFFTRRTERPDKYGSAIGKTIVQEHFSYAQRRPDGTFQKGQPMEDPFNSTFNEGGPTVNANNTELYFTVCERDEEGYLNCDIYFSKKSGYYWSIPESIGDHINKPDSWESQPSVSANGDRLYFASNRKGGQGGIDIYVCHRQEDGSWGNPKNLGSTINTEKDEKAPFIHPDGRTLYFASQGHPGLGGFDVFYSQKTPDNWSTPENIGYPINSEEDDLGLFVNLAGTKGYFSSNTRKGKGGWDVFEFDLPYQIKPADVTLVKGKLVDVYGEPEPEAELEIKNLETKEIQKVAVDEITGEYAAVVVKEKSQNHIVTVKKKGAAFSTKYVSGDLEAPKVVEADLEVRKIEKGEEYRLNDVVFATNSFELNKVARQIIDEFVLFLTTNPEIRVEIQGHTDNVGNDQDNLILSQNRAKVVYEYMVQHGISGNRLKHNGYGAKRPIADNNTEEGRAKNRRTVFVVL